MYIFHVVCYGDESCYVLATSVEDAIAKAKLKKKYKDKDIIQVTKHMHQEVVF